jgi:tryptophan 2,3-dioxygenase
MLLMAAIQAQRGGTMPEEGPLTYWDYLKLDRLLALQRGVEDNDEPLMSDELHFIVVHQAFELWFKLVLREVRLARDHLAAPRVPEEQVPYVVHHLRRVSEILKLAVEQFRVMETLTPQDFLDFRDKLIPASGFQSFQLRAIEILLGLEERQRLAYGHTDALEHIRQMAHRSPAGALAWGTIDAAQKEVSLRRALHEWLFRTPIQGSSPSDPDDEKIVNQFLEDYLRAGEHAAEEQIERLVRSTGAGAGRVRERFADGQRMAREFLSAADVEEPRRARIRRIRAALLFIESYRELPLLAWPRLLLDTIVELEEQLVLWRTRHARMVERMIGRRVGTGGSAGVDYLDQTSRYRIFTELWAARTLLLRRDVLPPLRDPRFYGFAA